MAVLPSIADLDSSASHRVFVVCDQDATAPIWGYIIREKGLVAILETSVQRAMERSMEEIPDLIVIDVNAPHAQRMELCRKFRTLSSSPILLFLPANNETEILEAYQNGVDECVVKPISPAIFLAKIMAWARRSWAVPMGPVRAGKLKLDPARRSALEPDGGETRLTNLEFRLLHLLMSHPGYVFKNEEIMQTVWGAGGDVAVLKNVVYRLRKKMEMDSGKQPYLIQTWPGGYSFQEV
ncbi:MAG: response regulator transcription factor [Chloroflexi bacterium]|nr:response regulator transcription factor [Chloroflexota bacterium]